MATITSNGTGGGNSNVGGSWAGGVAPVEGDKVIVASTDTITLTGTHVWGDDTTTAITINGILKASRSANSQLTCKGQILTAGTTTAEIDLGKAGDTIPSSYTSTILLNYSASLSAEKYGMYIDNNAKFSAYGATRVVNTTLNSTVSAGATSCVVADATGWAVGDLIVLPATDGTTTHYDSKTITSLSAAGPNATVGFSALTYGHAGGCDVGNFSSNVTINAYNSSYRSYVGCYHTNTCPTGIREIAYTSFRDICSNNGFNVVNTSRMLVNGNYGQLPAQAVWNGISHSSSYSVTSAGTSWGIFASLQGLVMNDIATFVVGSTAFSINANCNNSVNNSVVYYAGNAVTAGYGAGPIGSSFNNCNVWGTGGHTFSIGTALNFTVNDCMVHSAPSFGTNAMLSLSAGYGVYFNRCRLGNSTLIGTPSMSRIFSNQNGAYLPTVFTDCLFPSTIGYSSPTTNNIDPTTFVEIVNRDQDTTKQSFYTSAGEWHRDNSVISRGASSIRCDTITSLPQTFPGEITIPAQDGVAITIKGRLRKNSSYGSSTRPTVTLSGLGVSESFTMTDSTDTWEDFTLTGTPSAGYDGSLSIALTAQSTNSAGKAYFDGIAYSPFVTSIDHYGYTYDPTNNIRTVDPIITQTTEATVAAYTGISISSGTITLTSNHTIQELYDYCQYYRAQNQVSQFFTSPDGVNFSCSYNLTLNGGNITGTGNISMPTKTFTRTASETSSVVITHSAGTFTVISVTGIVSGSRLRLLNVTDNIELANEVVAGTTYSINFSYTSSKDIELSLTNVSGVTAYLTFYRKNTIYPSGLSFLATQELDTVYNANAIDGSTVTYFTADYPNIQIDISSGTSFSLQQLYAWYAYIQTTENGIRYLFGGLEAQDEFNYLVKTNIVDLMLDNTSGANVTMNNGYLSRDDGTSYIYSSTAKSIIPIYDRSYIADSDYITRLVSGLY